MKTKFRAWCEGKHDRDTFSEPQMDYDVTLSPDGNYCSVEAGWDIQGEYETVPIMQYTGLKDKNGKEIYEGDLIKSPKKIYEVVWNEECARWGLKHGDSYPVSIHHSGKTLEVIGNIYENKDLII